VNIHHDPDERAVDQPFSAQLSRIWIDKELFLFGEIIKSISGMGVFLICLKNIIKGPVGVFFPNQRYDLVDAIPLLSL